MNQPLTAERLDAMLKPRARDRIIWTLGGIAARIGTGTDFVRDTLAKQPGTPVKEIGGRYYAFEDELIAFLRGSVSAGNWVDKPDVDPASMV